jgi:tetratricopeptide (TPR) repeat protein
LGNLKCVALIFVLSSTCALRCAPAEVHQATPKQPSFDTWAAQAEAAKNQNRLDDAVLLYKKALAVRPQWSEGWWSLGTLLYDENNYAEAEQAFQKFVRVDTKNGTGRLMLALCQYELGKDDASLQNIFTAEKLGIEKNDQLQHVLQYHEGMLLLRKAQYESAIEVLAYLSREGVQSDDLYTAIGMGALMMSPREAPSAGSAGRTVVLRVGHAENFSLLQSYDAARKEYQSVVADYPGFPNIHYAYGRFLLQVQDTQAAVEQFQLELKRNPRHTRALLQIAATHYRIDSKQGIPYAEQAVQIDPNYPFGHYLLGLLSLDAGDTKNAVNQLEIAKKMIPNEAQVYFALGDAYASVGRKQEAAVARATFMRLKKLSSAQGPTTYGGTEQLHLDSSASQKSVQQERSQP